jgi:hypothetical protein
MTNMIHRNIKYIVSPCEALKENLIEGEYKFEIKTDGVKSLDSSQFFFAIVVTFITVFLHQVIPNLVAVSSPTTFQNLHFRYRTWLWTAAATVLVIHTICFQKAISNNGPKQRLHQ